MRIFQVINHFGLDRGGAERLARGLHTGLLDRGVDAHIVALEECPSDGLIGASSLGLPRAYDPRAALRLWRHLAPMLQPGDLVHAHLFPANAHVGWLRRLGRLRVPCVFTEHNTWNRRREHKAGRYLDRSIYPAFTRVFAISTATEQALVTAYPELAGRTEVVVNGAQLRFDTPPEREIVPEPLILSVGRLAGAKNYDTALRALAQIADQRFRYAILGDGPERESLVALAAELSLAERVEFVGHVADIAPWLRRADVFLMPSRWDGFGLAAVEAMNAALPVVASDVPGLADVVSTDCGRLVDPDDAGSIAAAVSEFLGSPALRHRLGAAGFARASQFGEERMTDDYLAAYRAVLAAEHG